mgnify:CR=1 FL=1
MYRNTQWLDEVKDIDLFTAASRPALYEAIRHAGEACRCSCLVGYGK